MCVCVWFILECLFLCVCCAIEAEMLMSWEWVGLETLFACYIIYSFLLQTITPCDIPAGDAVQRRDKNILQQGDFVSFSQSFIDLILQTNQHSNSSSCSLVKKNTNYLIWTAGFVHMKKKKKNPINTNSSSI